MLLLFSWTASGQPISRELRGKDTVSVFSIQQERNIVHDLQVGIDCRSSYKALQAVDSIKSVKLYKQDIVIQKQDSSLFICSALDSANVGTISKQGATIEVLSKKVGFWRSNTYVSIGLAIIFLIL